MSPVGSSLTSLFIETGEVEQLHNRVFKRVLRDRILKCILERGLTKVEVARRMGTSRTQLHKLLTDPGAGLTLETMVRVCWAVGLVVRPAFETVSDADYREAFPKG